MPVSPYAKAILRINGGAPQSGPITCNAGDVVRLRLENTAGLRSVVWQLYGYPPGWDTPAGWTLDAESRVVFSRSATPPDITLPSDRWGKWLIRAVVNDGTAPQLVDATSALEILSPNGLHAIPAGEEGQFGGAAEGWAKHLEENLRIIDGLLGVGGGRSQFWTKEGFSGVYAAVTPLPGRIGEVMRIYEPCTLQKIHLFRARSGKTGSTSIDMTRNGASIFVTVPSVNAGTDNASASGARAGVTSFVPGDLVEWSLLTAETATDDGLGPESVAILMLWSIP